MKDRSVVRSFTTIDSGVKFSVMRDIFLKYRDIMDNRILRYLRDVAFNVCTWPRTVYARVEGTYALLNNNLDGD